LTIPTAPTQRPLPGAAAQTDPVRVLLVDDSAVIRGLVSRWLKDDPTIDLVSFAVNGRHGVEEAAKHKPDVIILDIEMPEMDGITALPQVLKAAPGARVIMASTLTQRGAEVTIKALSLGASDYLPKPDANKIAGADIYKRDLIAKVKALGARRRPVPAAVVRSPGGSAPSIRPANMPLAIRAVSLQARPEAVFIGSSTGGPEALHKVVRALAGNIRVPVFITQHMPKMFTKILADHMSAQTGAKVVEAENGMLAEPGCFYIAPGDYHMTVERTSGVTRIRTNQEPPENFCRPAVDPMFRSAAKTFGNKALAVVLTGMGQDGCAGVRELGPTGALTLIQDEETSVVWGMPGAIAKAGLANIVKPIDKVAPAILDILRGVAP
jgi:two-component system, chemotaxis family, protein-glutamate methylesterase/glutaminase